jgi:hypothetical protein
MLDLLLIECVTKMKLGSNSVDDHPQLSHNRHPVDGALVGAGSLWPVTERRNAHGNERSSERNAVDEGLRTC